MVDMAVDPAVGEKTHEMHRPAGLFGPADGGEEGGILKKIPLPDRLGDAGELLIDHAPRADVGVAHLAVAHLPLGKTHGLAGAGQPAVGAGSEEGVQIGRFRQGDGVIGPLGGQAPAVQDHEKMGDLAIVGAHLETSSG